MLFDDEYGQVLKDKGILYAPDFITNAGVVINVAEEVTGNYSEEKVLKKVYNIYNTVEHIMNQSKENGIPKESLQQNMLKNV